MNKILLSVALIAPVMLALAQNAAAQANALPPALPFDGHARGVDQTMPPPPPPVGSVNVAPGTGSVNDTDSVTSTVHVVLSMGTTATLEEVDQGGRSVRTTTLKDGGAFVLKGKRYKAQIKDGEVSLADGGYVAVLGSANSVAADKEKSATSSTTEQMSAGEGVHELKLESSIFSNGSGSGSNSNNGNSNNNSNNGVNHF
ncbi:hypothetical protein G3A43_08000 [Paraburkholderia aspalathi]|nr:hypothetical protein [Paraburkholderia aspalathi]MBK3780198.1 hypothetical protein [Paraburkholderia aspalathi]